MHSEIFTSTPQRTLLEEVKEKKKTKKDKKKIKSVKKSWAEKPRTLKRKSIESSHICLTKLCDDHEVDYLAGL